MDAHSRGFGQALYLLQCQGRWHHITQAVVCRKRGCEKVILEIMSNLEEKSSTAMHSLCQVFISWIHEKKCRRFGVYKENIQHFVKEIKLKFRLCLLSLCSCGNPKWPDPKQQQPRWAEASLRSSKSLWSHFSVRVWRTCHSTFSSSQIGGAAAVECFKAIRPPTCLEEWGIWRGKAMSDLTD